MMLRALIARGPSVLLCEDLHWADDTTATVIARLADEISQLGVLMIVTTRPETEHLPGTANVTTIQLAAVRHSSSVQLVRSVARGAALRMPSSSASSTAAKAFRSCWRR